MSYNHFLILATQDGIIRFPILADGSLGDQGHALKGNPLEAVTQDSEGILYAGSDKGEIYRSDDQGKKWTLTSKGFPESRGLWSLVANPAKTGEIYAGLEPVSLWVSKNGGNSWTELSSLLGHPSSRKWHFFDPMKPHIRAIAFDKKGERLYIGIEVGGVLASYDKGISFYDRSQGVDDDIHTIHVAPDDPDHIFAMTGGGLFNSLNGGNSWKRLTNGLDRWYMLPLIFVSSDPNLICLGAGNTPPPAWKIRGADSCIYFSDDGGESFSVASGPFPLKGMLSSITADPEKPNHLFASTTDGILLDSTDGGRGWQTLKDRLPRIEEVLITHV